MCFISVQNCIYYSLHHFKKIGLHLLGELEVISVVVVFELTEFIKLQATLKALVLFDVVFFQTVPDQEILANEGAVTLVTLVV